MRFLMAAAMAAAAFGASAPAQAQNTSVEGRVDRLEREMRAVQRKVFPGGAGQTVEPQITPEINTVIPGTPATSPVADLTQRVSALEGQIQSITGQVEQGQYRLRQLEEAFNAYKGATDARLKALESGAASGAGAPRGDVTNGGGTLGDDEAGDTAAPAPRPTRPAATPAAAADKPAAKPTGGRADQVAAVERPNSGDPAEDGYTYGYRLWQAKLYPEARRELEAVATKYPQHRRASYAQNLLGRAYLDSGAPSLAAVAFYENYKKNPNGERAPDSLYYLAQALTKLKKPSTEVCKVYNELTQLYGERLSAEMKAGVAEGRAAQKCQ
jgi:TolA-binding protein